jgi:uncharacterized lipoprotein YajG
MRNKKLNQTIAIVLILTIAMMLAGCSQPQKKPDESPTAPQPQANMMSQSNPSSMMHDNPEAMQNAMSDPGNRQAMIKMMSSPQMRPAMMDMMKDPAMSKAMTDIMADPAMKDTFKAMVQDPRLTPIAREALKQ